VPHPGAASSRQDGVFDLLTPRSDRCLTCPAKRSERFPSHSGNSCPSTKHSCHSDRREESAFANISGDFNRDGALKVTTGEQLRSKRFRAAEHGAEIDIARPTTPRRGPYLHSRSDSRFGCLAKPAPSSTCVAAIDGLVQTLTLVGFAHVSLFASFCATIVATSPLSPQSESLCNHVETSVSHRS
jgi:hypothetical protein